MEKRKSKKDIVKLLLKKDELGEQDEEELLDLLIEQTIAIDIDKQEEAKLTVGDKLADKVSEVAGSWPFIFIFIGFLIAWLVLTTVVFIGDIKIDPFPYTLLNLVLSCIAAIQAPIIMMSQNREAKKDRLRSSNDYKTDLKSELILEELHNEMKKILANQNKILKYINEEKEK